MRIKMLQSAPGSLDGRSVQEYTKDEVYTVTDDLARVFIAEGVAVQDEKDPAVKPVQEPSGSDTENLKKSAPAENK